MKIIICKCSLIDIWRRLFPWQSLINTPDECWDIAKILKTCLHVYLHANNQRYSSLLSWDVAKIFQICCFGCFRHVWLWPPKRWYWLAENSDFYLHTKNQINPLPLSWNIAKILQTCYFGYFGHVWPRPPKKQ